MEFLVASLAIFRLTRLFVLEDGPYGVFARLRIKLHADAFDNPKSQLGQALTCFNCFSVWVAFPFAIYLAQDIYWFVIYVFALSATAMFLHKVFDKFEK